MDSSKLRLQREDGCFAKTKWKWKRHAIVKRKKISYIQKLPKDNPIKEIIIIQGEPYCKGC